MLTGAGTATTRVSMSLCLVQGWRIACHRQNSYASKSLSQDMLMQIVFVSNYSTHSKIS